jgi:hypothetical protein
LFLTLCLQKKIIEKIIVAIKTATKVMINHFGIIVSVELRPFDAELHLSRAVIARIICTLHVSIMFAAFILNLSLPYHVCQINSLFVCQYNSRRFIARAYLKYTPKTRNSKSMNHANYESPGSLTDVHNF